jgi:hypothetical protein
LPGPPAWRPAPAARAGPRAPPAPGQVGRLAARAAGRLDRPAERGRALEQPVERPAVERERAVAHAAEDLLEPVHVVLDRDEADHAAVALERVQRPEHRVTTSGLAPVALEPQQHGVEDGELLAGVLEEDRNQLVGDLELHQREPGALPGLTDR